MQTIDLKPVSHPFKTAMAPPDIEPNVPKGDLLFVENGEIVGFYLETVPEKERKLLELANHEFRSDRVPKQEMTRGDVLFMIQKDKTLSRAKAKEMGNEQFSTILGSIPKKPQMMRNYNTTSSVHRSKTAQHFIKAMLMLAKQNETLFEKYMPEQYKAQLETVKKEVAEKFRFGNLFTSTISNFNVAAKIHIDRKNIIGSYNFIYTSRRGALGGNLFLPDYDLVLRSSNNSLIVYPAWRNMHGVTPIHMRTKNDYRNTHIFYALRGFNE